MDERRNEYYYSKSEDNTIFPKTFLWMFIGLCVSGISAWVTSCIGGALISWPAFLVCFVLELIMVCAISGKVEDMATPVASLLFIIFSIVNGITLSTIFLVYELKSIVTVFFVSAAVFGMMALFGSLTKLDLSKIGGILVFTLLGLLVMLIINVFLKNSVLDTVLSILVVVTMMGCTAYDIYIMKHSDLYQMKNGHIFFALSLYLDFVNILLYLLKLFGKKK